MAKRPRDRVQPTLHRTPQANNRLTLAKRPRDRVQPSRTFNLGQKATRSRSTG
ncbi:MAG: hypothetical protein F6J90_25270 [Moorea sp. SIOASIH]|nr:hypothetical protein [Moorena sp. SIOASIH]